jgi:hypothetical protein
MYDNRVGDMSRLVRTLPHEVLIRSASVALERYPILSLWILLGEGGFISSSKVYFNHVFRYMFQIDPVLLMIVGNPEASFLATEATAG